MNLKGTAHVYGNDIDTDRIIAGKYTKTLNMQELADHVFEDLDPDFRSKLQLGDMLVAGTNFGCGSSREQAPLALKKAGVSVVIARSFARIFYRNAINIGLPIVEIKDHTINDKDILNVNLSTGEVSNLTKSVIYKGADMPSVMIDIIRDGGLVEYLKKRGTYQLTK
ncbi:3-isopropylmalate dehydratase small subunit [Cytobacillus firmus]|uniref:3-isopropylmalate dehydratase small subunit n=1 Tax=Cytobacillus firmus TaxID=1399 RepID=A0A800NBW2_CYTFI|nr:3-isopropylmalate dehydratase small subunit [Cytobacillus firmus]KAF0824980.1 3-isopropylmalate dehydratase small subunit [Cytobacillus firmus]